MTDKENKQKNNTLKKERVKLDQILKLLYSCSRATLLNSINGLFNTNYSPLSTEIEIIKTNPEFIKPYNLNVIRADLFIRVIERNNPTHYNDYHIEFQLSADDTMIARMFQYDIYHAMNNISVDDTGELVLRLSQSIVIYFEPSGKIPSKQRMRVDFANGTSNYYEAETIKYYDFNNKQLIDKKLYNLICLQLFCLRPELSKIKSDDKQSQQDAKAKAEKIIDEVVETITELHQDKIIDISDYDLIITALSKISEHLDKKFKFLKLGGNIEMIKTIADKKIVERATKAEQALQEAEKRAEQALENQKIEIAISLLDVLDVETISKKSKLPIERVEELKKEHLK